MADLGDPASISALAAIFGSLSGALASSVSTWITQRHQSRRDILAKRIFYREQLYSDFISESAHALADAVQHHLEDPNNLSTAYVTSEADAFEFFERCARER